MHPRFTQIVEELDRSRETLVRSIETVPAELRSTPPAPDSWSVAQVVEHLAIVERRITSMLRGQVANAQSSATTPVTTPESTANATGLDAARVLDRSRKIVSTSPPPTGTLSTEAALAELDAVRADLKAFIGDVRGVDLSAIITPHRAFGPLNVFDWVSFIAAHVGRHAEQIREAGKTLAVAPQR